MKLLCVSCLAELHTVTSMFPDSIMVMPCTKCIEIWRKENIGNDHKQQYLKLGKELAFDLVADFIKSQEEGNKDERY